MSESDRPIMTEVNLRTGEQVDRPFTDEEWDDSKAQAARAAIDQERWDADEAKRANDISEGKAKLKELGLSDDQISALVG